jgi:uncharacterized membrane protein YhhN
MTVAALLTLVCTLLVAGMTLADRRVAPGDSLPRRAVGKMAASTCFVGVALALGAAHSPYGQCILGALVLGWLGDALLLSRASRPVLAGLGAFLLSHAMFCAAFLAGPTSTPVLSASVVAATGLGAGVLRWLLPQVPVPMRAPVVAYVIVILAMVALAASHAAASGRWGVLLGATLFALSDVAVARERFVRPGPENRRWGWPLYFAGQLLLAWSVVPGAWPTLVSAASGYPGLP